MKKIVLAVTALCLSVVIFVGVNKDIVEQKVKNVYPVQVNYDLCLEASIKAGNYDWENSDITEKHFPTNRTGIANLDLVLYHPSRDISSDEVIKEMEKQGLRPAELHELLAFGAEYPEIQKQFPVVALASVWQGWFGGRAVPHLRGISGERCLYLSWFDRGWLAYERFLAVRES